MQINDIKINLMLSFRKLLLNFTNYKCHLFFDNFSFSIEFITVFLVSILLQYSSVSWFVEK